MFAPRTLFILGAGASKEVGMPLGWELAAQIHGMCLYERNSTGQIESHDSTYFNALRRAVNDERKFRAEYLPAVNFVRDGVREVASIDNFIDTHPNDDRVRLIGKTAIIRAILQKEAGSDVFADDTRANPSLDFDKVKNSWFLRFGRILRDGIPVEDRETVFDNLTVICFNYDRCLDQFLHLLVESGLRYRRW